MAQTLSIRRPDDWHHHFRDGERMKAVVPMVAKRFGKVIAMPNLQPPVVNAEQAMAYRARIMDSVPEGEQYKSFQPLMTLYLTDNTTPADIVEAHKTGLIPACKLYPAGATTNSDSGVTHIDKIKATLQEMEKCGMILLVHGEVTDPETDIFDRERIFIDRVLRGILKNFPKLKIVMEHITTKDAVDFVMCGPPNLAATITCHHLLYNRNALFKGGLRPHMYCLPVLKRETHRQALLGAIKSGSEKFFLGTDSAPHPQSSKESCVGCAGVFTGHAAIELYAEAFDSVGALNKLENFASVYGSKFYGLPLNNDHIKLKKDSLAVPKSYPYGDNDELVPLRSGDTISWSGVEDI